MFYNKVHSDKSNPSLFRYLDFPLEKSPSATTQDGFGIVTMRIVGCLRLHQQIDRVGFSLIPRSPSGGVRHEDRDLSGGAFLVHFFGHAKKWSASYDAIYSYLWMSKERIEKIK